MSKRFIIFSALLVLVLAAGSSLAAENASSDIASPGAEVSANADNVSPVKDETASPASDSQEASGSVAPANLQYIWSVTGIEADQITMVLNQTGKDLSGRAKYEGSDSNPWNAVVVGSVSGNDVDLVLTALIGGDMISTKLSGAFSADTIAGKFVQTDMAGKAKSGDFSAVWINPDTSAYTPAQVTDAQAKPAAATAPATAAAQPGDASTTTTTTNAEGTAGVTTSGSTVIGSGTSDAQPKAVQLGGKTQYTDVHKYAQQFEIGGDLSGVPPGMGGGSL